jgi:hypothetical protein
MLMSENITAQHHKTINVPANVTNVPCRAFFDFGGMVVPVRIAETWDNRGDAASPVECQRKWVYITREDGRGGKAAGLMSRQTLEAAAPESASDKLAGKYEDAFGD